MKMRLSRQKLPSQLTECAGLTYEELLRTRDRMELYDSLEPQMRQLVMEYGLAAGIDAGRRFYGRWAEARTYLEAQRRALQVKRWGNI